METKHMETQVDRAAARLGEIQRAVGQVVVGQERLVESLLVALLCRGHVLLEGGPGLAKTRTVRTLAMHRNPATVSSNSANAPGSGIGPSWPSRMALSCSTAHPLGVNRPMRTGPPGG